MLLLLSPAKKLDEVSPAPAVWQQLKATTPQFLEESQLLINQLSRCHYLDLMELMKISRPLAELNLQRYLTFAPPFTVAQQRQALRLFKGDVYSGLAVADFSVADLTFAQQHLRILSGLYGLLRPLDLMHPYRLEMGTPLATARGRNLYQFWGSSLSVAIDEILQQQENPLLLNLASAEYFKAVKPDEIKAPLVNVHFQQQQGDGYRVIGIYAKRARGLMSRYIIKNRIDSLEAVKTFTDGGYHFNAALSNERDLYFQREL
ncbi:MAG: peroxide stress protein YaaA [Gammaproteobacteria bacterium]|nr:peroxide stress protein YaaA [Gammaproteobacteria bacterium]